MSRVRRLLGAVLDLLLPAYCRHCGGVVSGGDWGPLLCCACADALPVHDAAVDAPLPVARAWALFSFDGPARQLLIDLKYEGVLRAGTMVGACMARAPGAGAILSGATVVIPVPLHWWRRWRRGHNQAAVLARSMCRERSDVRLLPALHRPRATAPQVGQARHRRLLNVAGAFALRPGYASAVRGQAVVLVDDVITTGATTAEAARCLIDAGAGEVRVYAAAWSR